jgi:hypothetical protein
MGKKYTTNFLEDTNGSTGASNQVLISTPSGIDWVDGSGSSIIGGPYVTIGTTQTITGTKTFTGNVEINGTIIGTDQTFGGAYRTFAFGNNANGYNRIFATNNASDGIYINASTGHGVRFRVNGGGTNVMQIDSSGNATFTEKIGIGTTSPGAPLDVNGNVYVRGTGVLYADTLAGYTAGVITLNASTNFIVPSGSVGIGLTNPDTLLHLKSLSPKIKLQDTGNWGSNATGGVEFYDQNSLMAFSEINSAGDYLHYLVEAGNMRFGTSNTERMRIDGSGRVGIGTTNPTANLHVYTSTNSSTIEVGRGAGRSSIKASADADGGYLALDSSGNGLILNHYSTDNVWLVTGGGNVGVGNTGPSQKLHITGNLRVTGTYYDSNNTPGTSGQILSSTATGTDWIDGSSIPGVPSGSGTLNTIPLWTPDGDTLGNSVITQSGVNVGIGTTSFTNSSGYSTLNINGNSGGQIAFQTAGTSKHFIWGTATNFNIYNGQAGNLILYTAAAERMRIDSSGAVLIGGQPKIDTATKLQVGGNDSGVTSIWSNADDIVFEHNTNLGLTFATPNDAAATIAFADPQSVQAGWIQYLHDVDAMRFGTNGNNERMRITNAGSVGIGTTSPGAKLDVAGTVKYNTQLSTNLLMGQKAFIGISSGGGAQKFKIYKNTNITDGYARFKVDRAFDYGDSNQMVQEAIFQRRNTNKNFVFRYDGDITTGDDVYLEVYELSNGQVEIWLCVDDYAQPVVEVISNPSTSEIFTSTSAGTPTGTLIHSSNPDTETPNWNSHQGAATFSGNVVAEGSLITRSVNANVTISGDTSGNIYYNNASGEHRWRADGSSVNSMNLSSTLLTVNENATFTGSVGIGTTSPFSTLEVSKNQNGQGITITQENAGSGYHSRLTFRGSNGSGGFIQTAALMAYQQANGASGYLRLFGGTTEGLQIKTNGSIQLPTYGAGTLVTDASGNITVSSGGGAGGPYLPLAGGTLTGALAGTSASFTGGLSSVGYSGTSGTFSASVTASGNSNTFGNTTTAALSATSGSFSSSVTAAGNSNSFGTTNFTTGLTSTYGNFSGAVNAIYFRTTAANSEYSLLTRDSTGNALFVQNAQSGTNQNIAIFQYGNATVNQGTTVLQVAKDKSYFANCNVGIGETSPDRRLVLDGTLGTASLEIKKESDRIVYLGTGSSAAGDDNTTMLLYHDDVIKVNINTVGDSYLNGGKVAIGLTNPTTHLEVVASQSNSSIRAGGLEMQSYAVNNSWYAENLYYNGGWKLRSNGYATQMYMRHNKIIFNRFATGNAGDFVTPIETMRLEADGKVGIDVTNPSAKLQVTSTGGNGSAGYSSYGILTTAGGSNQTTIGAMHDGDGYANLNLGSNVSSSNVFWHISKRVSNSNDFGGNNGLDYFYYNGSGFTNVFGFSTTGYFKAADGATFGGTVTAATYYKSSGTSTVLGTNSSGEVLLRPTAWNLSTAQSSFTTTLATIGTNATFAGETYFNKGVRFYRYTDQANFWSVYTNTDDSLRFNYNGAGNDEITIDNSGNSTFAGTVKAVAIRTDIYQDSASNILFTAGNAATGASRSFNLRHSGTSGDPSASDDSNSTGITWGQRSDSNPYYIIYPNLENWNSSGNYSKLTLAWHTGIKIGAASQYGGTRFYNNSPDISGAGVIMNVGVGSNNVGVEYDLNVGGNATFAGKVGIGVTSLNSMFTLQGNETAGQTITHLHLNSGNNNSFPFLASLNNATISSATYGWTFNNSSSTGNLEIGRRNNSTTTSTVLTLERSSGNATFAGDISTSTVQISSGQSYSENIRMFPHPVNDYSSLVLGAVSGTSGTGYGQWTLVRYPYATHSHKFSIRHSSSDIMVMTTGGDTTFAGSINTSGSINLTNAGVNTIAASNSSNGYLRFLVDQQGVALTLNADTTSTFGGIIYAVDGNKGAPGISFANDTDTGIFRDSSDKLAFATGANTRMIIESNGEVGINQPNPSATLHLRAIASNGVPFKLEAHPSTSVSQMLIYATKAYNSTDAWYNLVCEAGDGSGGQTNTLIIERDGDVRNKNNSYGQISDIRLKENITDATPKLEDIKKLKVKNFNLIGDDLKQIGLIAQEVEEVFPGLVKEDKQPDVNGEEGGVYKSVKYSVLVPMLIKAMQEQQEQIDELKKQINN